MALEEMTDRRKRLGELVSRAWGGEDVGSEIAQILVEMDILSLRNGYLRPSPKLISRIWEVFPKACALLDRELSWSCSRLRSELMRLGLEGMGAGDPEVCRRLGFILSRVFAHQRCSRCPLDSGEMDLDRAVYEFERCARSWGWMPYHV